MDTSDPSPQRMAQSVVAVPPLARDPDGVVSPTENAKIIQHIEQGGVNILLYGGNAMFYHLRPSEYETTLRMLSDSVADSTAIVPSVGPTFGMMMDQAEILRSFDFPTVMVLPQRDITDPIGIANGIRAFAGAFEKPVVLYLKFANWLPTDLVENLVNDGLVSWIKYAVVREDPADDDELKRLVDAVGGERIISGIGEQPAIIHMRDFGVNGFTSGCVCIAPARSIEMLSAIQAKDYGLAETLRVRFQGLEDLRNSIHPIRVLHAAVESCGIARCGSVLPLLSDVEDRQLTEITRESEALLNWDRETGDA